MQTRISLLFFTLLTGGCEFGTDPSQLISPNYHLLGECERPDLVESSALVSDALCGSFEVFEDRDDKTGRKIGLNVMLLPATTAVVKPDPIFFLAGGPGQSAVDLGVRLFSPLRKSRRERDIVLVDQRGTGKSNSLGCNPDETNYQNWEFSFDEATAKIVSDLKTCLEELDANPALYTTPIAMDDLDEIRQILGYQDINLLGGSYGTRAAFVYLRRHGETVRSAVLDGVAPMSMPIPANIAVDAQSAFDLVLKDCKEQSVCNSAFPDLEIHFRELLERLKTAAPVVEVFHPRTQEKVEWKIESTTVNAVLRSVLYDRTLSTLIPLAIEEAYRENYQPIATLGFAFAPEGAVLNLGMMSSVLCAEDMNIVDRPNHTADFDNVIYTMLEPICEFWPKGEIPESYFDPVTSDVPILMLSGKLDPVTPPRYAWEAGTTLTNVEHVVVSGVGHGVMIHGCVPDLIADFFDDPDPGSVKAACTSTLVRKDFFTSFSGPVLGERSSAE